MIFTIFMLIIFYITSETETSIIASFLPKESQGWKMSGKPRTYPDTSIYDYMNGAGEIYLAYDFKNLVVQRYVKKNSPEIIVEVFDMGVPEFAYGVFSHTQGGGNNTNIGQGSEYSAGLLYFWKERYFVCVRAEYETKESKNAVLTLGESIATKIKAEGEKPHLLNFLPYEALVENSIRYFFRHEILNYHYFVADKNILLLNNSTRAILARYKNNRDYLLLVQYPTETDACSARDNFVKIYMPEASDSGIVQMENGKWTAVSALKNYVIIIFDAVQRDYAQKKIESLTRNILQ